jgi:hypothetical protein
MCSFGAAPSTLSVTPEKRVATNGVPAATAMDFAPMKNVAPFGMCMSPSNPQVIAATSAAMGVFTPQPCIPATTQPWTPGSATVRVGNIPALNNTCTLTCLWGGVITITNPGPIKVNVP